VKYLIVGAYAVAVYTEPRYTKDLDIWVDPALANAKRVFKALKDFKAPLSDVTVEDFTKTSMVYQIGVEPVRVDIIMGVTGITFEQAWPNRNKVTFGKQKAPVIALKDLIKAKKASSRQQDKIDAARLTQRLKRK
jgi:hypothetical protein